MKLEITTVIPILLTFILGYFVYGGISGALSMSLLYVCLSTVTILSIIPVIGWVLSIFLSELYVIPKILSFTGLYDTWLVTVISCYMYLIGLILTIIVIINICVLIIDFLND